MKIYKKPELNIEKFDVNDIIAEGSGLPELDLESDEIFFGAEGDTGYIVQ